MERSQWNVVAVLAVGSVTIYMLAMVTAMVLGKLTVLEFSAAVLPLVMANLGYMARALQNDGGTAS